LDVPFAIDHFENNENNIAKKHYARKARGGDTLQTLHLGSMRPMRGILESDDILAKDRDTFQKYSMTGEARAFEPASPKAPQNHLPLRSCAYPRKHQNGGEAGAYSNGTFLSFDVSQFRLRFADMPPAPDRWDRLRPSY
jgi:hypothetical protein